MTPLYYASLKGHISIVRLLIQYKAGVNICTEVDHNIYSIYHRVGVLLTWYILTIIVKCMFLTNT